MMASGRRLLNDIEDAALARPCGLATARRASRARRRRDARPVALALAVLELARRRRCHPAPRATPASPTSHRPTPQRQPENSDAAARHRCRPESACSCPQSGSCRRTRRRSPVSPSSVPMASTTSESSTSSRTGTSDWFDPIDSGCPFGSTPFALIVQHAGASSASTSATASAPPSMAPPPSRTTGRFARLQYLSRASNRIGSRRGPPRWSAHLPLDVIRRRGDDVDRNLNVYRPRPRAIEHRERTRQHCWQLIRPQSACD